MRRHDLDVFSLIVGLFFVGAALIWGLAEDPGATLDSWPLPLLLITVGAVGLFAALTRNRDPDGDRT